MNEISVNINWGARVRPIWPDKDIHRILIEFYRLWNKAYMNINIYIIYQYKGSSLNSTFVEQINILKLKIKGKDDKENHIYFEFIFENISSYSLPALKFLSLLTSGKAFLSSILSNNFSVTSGFLWSQDSRFSII